MSYELKPCPFCGGSEIYAEEYEHHHGAVRWRVFCAGCMAGIDTGTRQSGGAAVHDWNRRAERTCRNVSTRYESFKCSECGCAIYDTSQIGSDRVYYCSDCGAKVVER